MANLRTTLNDRTIFRLPPAQSGQYVVRDEELPGFSLVVGARKKTFTVKGEFWSEGRRQHKTMAIGAAGDITTREARTLAKEMLAKIAKGEFSAKSEKPKPQRAAGVTLREAWARYCTAHMERKSRSAETIRGYRSHVERLMADWLDLPLFELGDNPALVAERHDKISRDNGPNAANGCMRTLRAVYNHARRSHRYLPPENPTLAVDWNEEKRRDTAMGLADLPGWFEEAGRMRHAIRREFHLFTLLSGSRPGALCRARLDHLDLKERVLHIPRPKGGTKRAFSIPLSRPMIRCLIRAIRASRAVWPRHAETWIFAAESATGHMVVHKEARHVLSKFANDLRQTYRTVGQAAGLSEIDMHLLMNHSLPGVNAGYITRAKLLGDHLRFAQEKLSDTIITAGAPTPGANADGRLWPHLPSRKIGDPIVDPVPPDPRSLAGLQTYEKSRAMREANDAKRAMAQIPA